MRAVIQRVQSAQVSVEGRVAGKIGLGLLVFLGISQVDEEEDMAWLLKKIAQVRIFPDEGKMAHSILDINGNVLLISQFTLFGNLRKGSRPSFQRAAAPEKAIPLYEAFKARLSVLLEKTVESGEFGAMMDIEAHHDGPLTLILDSRDRAY